MDVSQALCCAVSAYVNFAAGPCRIPARNKEALIEGLPHTRDTMLVAYCTVTVTFMFGCTVQVILNVPASGNTTSFV